MENSEEEQKLETPRRLSHLEIGLSEPTGESFVELELFITYTCLLILALCPFQIPCCSFLLYHQYLKRNSFETEHFVLMQSPQIKENPQSRIRT